MHRGPVLFQQVLDMPKKHVSKALRRVQRELLHHDVGFGKRDTAEFRRCVDGEDHLDSIYT